MAQVAVRLSNAQRIQDEREVGRPSSQDFLADSARLGAADVLRLRESSWGIRGLHIGLRRGVPLSADFLGLLIVASRAAAVVIVVGVWQVRPVVGAFLGCRAQRGQST